MGVTQSLQRIENFYSYHKLVQNNQSVEMRQYQLYFGPQFQIYASKFNPKQLYTKHTLKFIDKNEMQNYLSLFSRMKEKKHHLVPFNILYPLNVFYKQTSSPFNRIPGNCGQTDLQVSVVHKWLGRTLIDYVKDNNSPLLQQSVWFIINELSKSLQILQQNNHASYHLMPQNIWYNSNHNWFLYDGHYVIGVEGIQQFYLHKLKSQHFLSEEVHKKISNNQIITHHDSIQEDIYCLGYCIVFMITGVHPKQMPQKPKERETYVQQLLNNITAPSLHGSGLIQNNNPQSFPIRQLNKYSNQLIGFVKGLIKPDSKRRFTIRHIRSYLKSKQQQIFMKQEQQWSRQIQEKSSSRFQSSNLENSVPLSWKKRNLQRVKSFEREYEKRITTQTSQYEKNFASIRTLKKQQIHQKIVMVSNNDLAKPYLNLIENDNRNNKIERQGHFTPIRKIDESRYNQFNFQSNQKNSQLIPTKNKYNEPHQSHLREMNSPTKGLPSQVYMSPNKESNSSINTKALPDSKFTNQFVTKPLFTTKPHFIVHSPSYQPNVFSPNKVKMTYFSPQKPFT